MQPPDDAELLTEYVARNSEDAFTELVGRHAALVYSAALRQVREPHLAEDVTQAVFILLARKARSMSRHVSLSGWLCRAAHFVSRDALRAERRRLHREQMVTAMENTTDTNWMQIAPLLDEVVAQLGDKDRSAIVLRYYEKKSLGEIGAVLGVDADAAQKRVSRALEKLRQFFAKRGVSSTTAILAAAISANSIQAAPVMPAKSIAAVAMAKGATASGSTLTLIQETLKIMAYKKTAAVITGIAAVLLVGVIVSVPSARTAVRNLPQKIEGNIPGREKDAALRRQMLAMKTSVWPALMKYADAHEGQFPKSMDELHSFLPPELAAMDDAHWRITAGDKSAVPNTPEQLTFCEQINQPAGQPRIVLYADGHVERRK